MKSMRAPIPGIHILYLTAFAVDLFQFDFRNRSICGVSLSTVVNNKLQESEEDKQV